MKESRQDNEIKTFRHNENSLQFAGVLLVCQIIFMILFGLFVRYNDGGVDAEMDRTYPCELIILV